MTQPDLEKSVMVEVKEVRVVLTPRPPLDEQPKSWRDVATMSNLAAMRFTVSLVRLLGDVVDSARALVRGLGSLPSNFRDKRLSVERAEAQMIEKPRTLMDSTYRQVSDGSHRTDG